MPPHASSRTSSTLAPSKLTPSEKPTPSATPALLPAPAVQPRRPPHIGPWARLLRKFGAGTAPECSSAEPDAESVAEPAALYGHYAPSARKLVGAEAVDEVVVDREWGEEVRASSVHSGVVHSGGGHSGVGGSGAHAHPATGDEASMVHEEPEFVVHPVLVWLRWRAWASVMGFFVQRFMDEKSEEQYRKETWFLRKNLALWSAGFFILNWVLAIIFIPKPIIISDKIFHYAIAPALTFPIFFMVLYDLPRDRNLVYQTFLTVSTWMWGCFQILTMYLCAYYGGHKPIISCGTKDFLATFYYANGPQTIALFGLGMHRFPALVGSLTFMTLCFGLIVPDRTTWVRNVINFVCYQAFLLYLHYMRENAERRLYTLRDQLKVQYRATQKAQINERKAADSKRRLTSYVFHEVRVPLNTALLAVQNMAASGAVARAQAVEFSALEGSLSMMSKVLNDVLDFNRMDSGRFESVARPYPFHQVMRSLFVPLKLATDARGLAFVTDLDGAIDSVARRALYEAQGCDEAEVARRLMECPTEDGVVVGDETRLRQIITNLASNACKFTPAGGQLTITTRLLLPHRGGTSRQDSDTLTGTDLSKDTKEATTPSPLAACKELDGHEYQQQLSRMHLARHNSIHSKPPPMEQVVVRIEVSDTGCGIKPMDMVHCKLFSAFNQTEMGRQQGGKGTGLGLALVRQIVKLSGGRLGVQSKAGHGSTFWVELPLGVGEKATPYLTAPQLFTPQTEGGPHARPEEFNADHFAVRDPAPPVRAKLHRTTSAMHTIMDQGGPVEISTDARLQGRVLTRTLGDPSTGTDPTPSAPLTTPESSPTAPAHTRPTFVELPPRPRFSLDEPADTGSPLPTPLGSAHSGASAAWEPGLRVLVVDDDPLTRKLMGRMLARLGCRVSTAENGEIALELILGNVHATHTPASEESGLAFDGGGAGGAEEGGKYAVVFLDNQMPVLSGLEAIARLREMGRRDFVVGVTGNALLADQQEYLEAGVDRVLTKPVFEKSLKAMLTQAEERRKRGTPISEPPEPTAPP